MTKILTIILLSLALILCWYSYDSATRADEYLRANRILSELVINGDAQIQVVIEPRTGDALIRVNNNNDNIHIFPAVCKKEYF